MSHLLALLLAATTTNDPQWLVVPLFGGSSDLGFVMGGVVLVTKPSDQPGRFDWQVASQSSTSIKTHADGVSWPLQRHYLRFQRRGLFGRTDLWTELRYERLLDSGYFGGDSGGAERPADPPTRMAYQYTSVEPHGRAQLLTPISDDGSLQLVWGFDLKYAEALAPEGSLLARDMAGDEPPVGAAPHWTLQPYLALNVDDRDHRYWPRRGRRHLLSLRGAPGLFDPNLAFVGTSLLLRRYVPLFDRDVLALRLWFDAIFGSAPFEELARGGDQRVGRMVGHSRAMRGIPAGRVHAPYKAMATIEHRAKLATWSRPNGRRWSLTSAVFAEAGRGWTGFDDNGGWALSVGGGPRFHVGPGVAFRLDLAYSPMASNLSGGPFTGIYVDLLESF